MEFTNKVQLTGRKVEEIFIANAYTINDLNYHSFGKDIDLSEFSSISILALNTHDVSMTIDVKSYDGKWLESYIGSEWQPKTVTIPGDGRWKDLTTRFTGLDKGVKELRFFCYNTVSLATSGSISIKIIGVKN